MTTQVNRIIRYNTTNWIEYNNSIVSNLEDNLEQLDLQQETWSPTQPTLTNITYYNKCYKQYNITKRKH